MRRRHEAAVGPALHHVADVDHESAGDGRGADPTAGAIPYLEAAHVVLQQDGEGARLDALGIRIRRLRRIVQETQLGQGLAEMLLKKIVRQAERAREG